MLPSPRTASSLIISEVIGTSPYYETASVEVHIKRSARRPSSLQTLLHRMKVYEST